jgi:hypothetical protein
MAIGRLDKRSAVVWTRPAAIQMGIAAALMLLALLLLWSAFKRYMVKSNYAEALLKYDSGRRPEAKAGIEGAVSWRSDFAEARELLAKVLVEADQLDAAERAYGQLVENGGRSAVAECGLGVIGLRRSAAEKVDKKAAELLKKAKDHFTAARAAEGTLVEAQIGQATVDLVAGLRGGEGARVDRARGEFVRIHRSLRGSEETAGQVTREGYIDLFAGLARSHSLGQVHSPEALAFIVASRRYQPEAADLWAGEICLLAKQVATTPQNLEQLKAQRYLERSIELKNKISIPGKVTDRILDPWVSLTMAAAAAFHREGDLTNSYEMLTFLVNNPRLKDPIPPLVLEAALRFDVARKPESNWNKRQGNYNQAMSAINRLTEKKELEESAHDLARAAAWNNRAFLEEDQAALGGGEMMYERAVTSLKKALEAEEKAGIVGGSYEVRRNLAVIQKRRNKPDFQEHFDAAVRAGEKRQDEWVRRDLEELRKLAGTP